MDSGKECIIRFLEWLLGDGGLPAKLVDLAREYLRLEMTTEAGRINAAGMALAIIVSIPITALSVFAQFINALFSVDHEISTGSFLWPLIVVASMTILCVAFLVRDSRAGRD